MESLMPTIRLLFRLLFITTYCPLMLLMLPILEKPSITGPGYDLLTVGGDAVVDFFSQQVCAVCLCDTTPYQNYPRYTTIKNFFVST